MALYVTSGANRLQWWIEGKTMRIKGATETDTWELWISSDQKVLTLTTDIEGKPYTVTFNRAN